MLLEWKKRGKKRKGQLLMASVDDDLDEEEFRDFLLWWGEEEEAEAEGASSTFGRQAEEEEEGLVGRASSTFGRQEEAAAAAAAEGRPKKQQRKSSTLTKINERSNSKEIREMFKNITEDNFDEYVERIIEIEDSMSTLSEEDKTEMKRIFKDFVFYFKKNFKFGIKKIFNDLRINSSPICYQNILSAFSIYRENIYLHHALYLITQNTKYKMNDGGKKKRTKKKGKKRKKGKKETPRRRGR